MKSPVKVKRSVLNLTQIYARRGTFDCALSIPPKCSRPQKPQESKKKRAVRKNRSKLLVKQKKDKEALNESSANDENVAPKKASSPTPRRINSFKEFIAVQENRPSLGSRAVGGFVNLVSPLKRSHHHPGVVTAGVEQEPPLPQANCHPSSSRSLRGVNDFMEEDCEVDTNRSTITTRSNLAVMKDEGLALRRLSKNTLLLSPVKRPFAEALQKHASSSLLLKTPSPTKKILRRSGVCVNLGVLLCSPARQAEEEGEKPVIFVDESDAFGNALRKEEGTHTSKKKKKADAGNYVRINLRKKTFAPKSGGGSKFKKSWKKFSRR